MKKKIITSLLSITVLSSSFIGVVPVLADEFDAQIEQAQKDAVQSEEAANNLDAMINQLTSDVNNTQAALSSLTAEIQKNEALIAQAMENLEIANKEMNQLIEEVTILEENISRREEKLIEQARKIQKDGNSSTYLEYILDSKSLTDIFARVDLVSNIIDTSNKMMEEQIKDKEAVEEKTELTERKIVQQNALAAELEKTSASLEEQRASQAALVVQLEIERNAASSDRESLIAQRNEALQRVSDIQSNQAEARAAAEEVARQRAEEQERANQAQETTNVSVSSSNRESSNAGNAQATQPSSNNSGSNKQTPAPKPDPKPTAPTGSVLSVAAQLAHDNRNYTIPYRWGGTTQAGFDCSGFVQFVFKQAGKSISRTTYTQWADTARVTNPQPGDLIFFSNYNNGDIDHVGIYIGGGQFIGSQSSTGVAYASSTSGYWGSRVVGYGRY